MKTNDLLAIRSQPGRGTHEGHIILYIIIITPGSNTWFVRFSHSPLWAGEHLRTTHNQSKTFRWTQTCYKMNENTLTSRDSFSFINNVWNNELFIWVVGIANTDCVHITMAQKTSTVPEFLNLGGPDYSGSL